MSTDGTKGVRVERDAATVMERRVEVQAAIGRGWSMAAEAKLAAKFGCTTRTIRRDRRWVLKRMAKRYPISEGRLLRHRAEIVASLQTAQAMAAENNDPSGLTRATMGLARVLGVEAPRKVEVTGARGGAVEIRTAEADRAELLARIEADAPEGA